MVVGGRAGEEVLHTPFADSTGREHGHYHIVIISLLHHYFIQVNLKMPPLTSTSFRKSSSRSLRKPQVQSDNSKDKLAPGILCLADSMVFRVDSPIGKCVHEQGLVRNVKDRAALTAVTIR